jgi:competence protein ComEA
METKIDRWNIVQLLGIFFRRAIFFMKSLKSSLRNYFGFTRAEINGFFVLLLLMLVALAVSVVFPYVYQPKKTFSDPQSTALLDSLVAVLEQELVEDLPENRSDAKYNPNFASARELKQIGLPQRVVHNLIRYREKGGRFTCKRDLLAIYGLDEELLKNVESGIDLPDQAYKADISESVSLHGSAKKSNQPQIDINVADSLLLQSVKGVGPVLASRIVRYRELLGGFIHLEQLSEVYGLKEEVIEQLNTVSYINKDFEPEKLDLNAAEFKQMVRHPYISYALAKVLLSYRNQHGRFNTLDEVLSLKYEPKEALVRLEPYLTVK